jgi:hypothetical protein
MKLTQLVINLSGRAGKVFKNMERGPEFRTRKLASWVKVGIVESSS